MSKMELQEILKILDFNEEDRENKEKIVPILKKYGDEIASAIADAFSKSPEVAKALQKSDISFFEIKDRWLNMVETMLSSEFDGEWGKKILEFSKGLTEIGIIDQNFVALGISLFLMKSQERLSSLGLDSNKSLLNTLLKMFSAFLTEGVGLYAEQLIDLFLKFTGINRELFMRQIEIEAKKAKGNA